MDIADLLDILMFLTLCGAILIGFPVAFTLAAVSLLYALLGSAFGVFNLALLGAFPARIYGIMTNQVLIAVPLFILMGVILERSRVAEQLLESMAMMFGTLRGGLAVSVCVVGALLAASTGIVGATVVTMGLLALPTMLRRGYDPRVACGTISAAGTLGQIIPPSIVLILLGEVLSTAYQRAQLEQGIFAPQTLSVGDLFAGALIPGLVLVGMYVAYLSISAWMRPERMPAVPREQLGGIDRSLARELAEALVPPVVLIVAVLGSILGGIATPTEAASVGATGALLLAGHRLAPRAPWPILAAFAGLIGLLILAASLDLRLGRAVISPTDRFWIGVALFCTALVAWGILAALWRTWRARILQEILYGTTQLTSMVFVILIGAALFTIVFRGLGGDLTVQHMLEGLPGGVLGAMLAVMATMFLLGFFLDFIEITLVVVPIVAPPLILMDVDPLWLGIMIAINLQTSFLTPPFGFALFYLRGVAPPEVRTLDLYKGVIPFLVLQLLMLVVLAFVPGLATWLPRRLF
jgi:tripartite ATP-independent transporter DctM subunit